MVEGLSRLGTSHQSQRQDAAGAGHGPRLVTHGRQKAGEPPRARHSARGQRSVLRLPPAVGRPPGAGAHGEGADPPAVSSLGASTRNTGGSSIRHTAELFSLPIANEEDWQSAAGWVFWGALCSLGGVWQDWQPRETPHRQCPRGWG